MFRYLKTGLAGIDRAECDKLENYVVLWEIQGKMWLRDVPWTANPDGYGAEMTPERRERSWRRSTPSGRRCVCRCCPV